MSSTDQPTIRFTQTDSEPLILPLLVGKPPHPISYAIKVIVTDSITNIYEKIAIYDKSSLFCKVETSLDDNFCKVETSLGDTKVVTSIDDDNFCMVETSLCESKVGTSLGESKVGTSLGESKVGTSLGESKVGTSLGEIRRHFAMSLKENDLLSHVKDLLLIKGIRLSKSVHFEFEVMCHFIENAKNRDNDMCTYMTQGFSCEGLQPTKFEKSSNHSYNYLCKI